jgi:hypothetical protein
MFGITARAAPAPYPDGHAFGARANESQMRAKANAPPFVRFVSFVVNSVRPPSAVIGEICG